METPPSEQQRKLEQLMLHAKALQLLSSALSLAKEQLRARHLVPTAAVRKGERTGGSLCTGGRGGGSGEGPGHGR